MGGKRGNNEGSIYQRGDTGQWIGAVTTGLNARGRPRRKTVTGKTRAEVARKLAVLLHDRERGLPPPARQTLRQFLTTWIEETVKTSTRPRTYESYKTTVEKHIIPILGRHELTKLTAQHVNALLAEKEAAGLSPQSVRYIRSVLRTALNQAVKWDLVARNVATLARVPRVERPEMRYFTPEQARRFLVAIRGNRLETLYTLALYTGLRQGEALALRWDDVDVAAATIRIRASLQRIGGKLTFVQPKTEKSRRTLALPGTALASLRAHRARQVEERAANADQWQDHNLVFASIIGTPLEKSNIDKRFKAILERAGLPKMRFHDLRHSYASLALSQNEHPKTVQENLGHSQISMTLDIYSHLMPSTQREAAARMDALLMAES